MTPKEIADKDLIGTDIAGTLMRAAALGFHWEELSVFERAIDDARRGYLSSIFAFFDIPYYKEYNGRWGRWEFGQWREQIPEIEATIKEMKANGH